MPKNNSTCCAAAQPCTVAAPGVASASTPEYTLAIEQEVQQGFRKTVRTRNYSIGNGDTKLMKNVLLTAEDEQQERKGRTFPFGTIPIQLRAEKVHSLHERSLNP